MMVQRESYLSRAFFGLLLTTLLATACDPATVPVDGAIETDAATDAAAPTTPTVLSNGPIGGAMDVALNTSVSVTFSEPMDGASLGATTFTITFGDPAVLVPGTMIYAGSTAVLWPTEHLASDTMFTATVTTDAVSAAGVPLVADHVWSFTTGSTWAPGLPVALGTAGDFAVLAKAGISTVPTSSITGDIGISPAAASFITGFSLTADATNAFATSPQVTGRVYAADYAVPTPSAMTTAIGDMELAFTDAAGRARPEGSRRRPQGRGSVRSEERLLAFPYVLRRLLAESVLRLRRREVLRPRRREVLRPRRRELVPKSLGFQAQQADFDDVLGAHQDLRQVEWLADEIPRASSQRPQLVTGLGGDDEDGEMTLRVALLKALHDLKPVHVRHLEVEQDQSVAVLAMELADQSRIGR